MAGSWRAVRETGIGSAIFAGTVWVLFVILDLFPRNADNSMMAEILTPAAAAVLIASVWVLKRSGYRPMRYAAWCWAVLSSFGVVFGTLVLLLS